MNIRNQRRQKDENISTEHKTQSIGCHFEIAGSPNS